MDILTPPVPLPREIKRPAVFLAGSIERGAAEQWQHRVIVALSDLEGTILNPRRDAWDASWRNDADFIPFRQQVEWELAAQERSGLIAFYFDPETKAPVTLLELGLAARGGKAIVCCPRGYWRKGNVDVVCDHFRVRTTPTLESLIRELRAFVSS